VGEDDYTRNYAALTPLYGEWARGQPERFALVAAGEVRAIHNSLTAAHGAVRLLPDTVDHALIVALWPLEGWRHPRFVVESLRHPGSPPPTEVATPDPLARDFLVAERLRRDDPTEDEPPEPYLLIKDGALLGRYKRVTQARQAVDAAMPPLAPVVFTSLRLGRIGEFKSMVLQALIATPFPA
jgi:hypothetical protein